MARKYYRTVITVEVLSEGMVGFEDLEDLAQAITVGDCSGKWEVTSQEKVDGPTMAKLLKAQNSDPGFLGLDEAGNEVED